MRTKRPYISIERTDAQHDLYKVHALLELPTSLEVVSNKIIYDGIETRKGAIRSIRCSKFLLKLKPGVSTGGVIPFESDEFTRDEAIEYIWVKVVDPQGVEPNEGAIGNYEDPD